jgi:hypothetical protein
MTRLVLTILVFFLALSESWCPIEGESACPEELVCCEYEHYLAGHGLANEFSCETPSMCKPGKHKNTGQHTYIVVGEAKKSKCPK